MENGCFAFLSPLFGGLGATYDIHLGLIGKRVVDVSVNCTFFARCYDWGATGDNGSKIGDFAPTRSVWPKISHRRGSLPPIIVARIVRPMNALRLCGWEFSHKKLRSGLASSEVRFYTENGRFASLSPHLGA